MNTLLLLACKNGYLDVVEALLRQPSIDVFAQDGSGINALHALTSNYNEMEPRDQHMISDRIQNRADRIDYSQRKARGLPIAGETEEMASKRRRFNERLIETALLLLRKVGEDQGGGRAAMRRLVNTSLYYSKSSVIFVVIRVQWMEMLELLLRHRLVDPTITNTWKKTPLNCAKTSDDRNEEIVDALQRYEDSYDPREDEDGSFLMRFVNSVLSWGK